MPIVPTQTPSGSDFPDYVLEAHFKTLLRKARLFDFLEKRVKYLEIERPDALIETYEPEDGLTLRELCEALIRLDPDFQWLRD